LKIGIFAPFAYGDMTICTNVLKHKDELWGAGAEVFWYSPEPYSDILKYNPYIKEVRSSHGFDWHQIRPDMQQTWVDSNLKSFPIVADLDRVYFPCTWDVPNPEYRNGIQYVRLHRKTMAIPDRIPLGHPCLFFSDEENLRAENFVQALPTSHKRIMFETINASSQTPWNDAKTRAVCSKCKEILGENCSILFASKPILNRDVSFGLKCDQLSGVALVNGIDLSEFTIRQLIPVYNRCHLFIGIASGITAATCAWSANPDVPRIEYTGAWEFFSNPIARGHATSHTDWNAFMNQLEVELRKLC
jgi:hypothetical protein